LHLTSASATRSAIAAVLYGGSAVAVFALIAPRAQPAWWLRGCEFLGVRSYTLYIVHFPFLALLGAAVIQTQGQRPLHGWFAFGGVILAVAFGCACFALCERHFLHPRIRIKQAMW
jgi:peptidoglycan/LPS O-acetylase OafA/YrhL